MGMEWNPYLGPRMSSWMHKLEKDEEMIITLPVIPQPKTPNEPMEFLARSWTPSAADVTQALAQNNSQFDLGNVEPRHKILLESQMANKNVDVGGNDMIRSVVGKWFQGKDSTDNGQAMKRKDKARLDNAHIHAALSIASLAAGLAAVAATDRYDGNEDDAGDKMKAAMASATELLASHCVHLAELAGAENDGLANAVRSSVDIRSAGDLLTLTAAAATALRAEATLRARLPKDAKKNAAISPYDRSMADDHKSYSFRYESRKQDTLCQGDLLQLTHKGHMRWKHVTLYINTKSQQVMMKIKNKHIGGAFTKKHKCAVYGVCDESATWPFRKEKQEIEADVCLGLKTGKGFLEFKCKSKIHKEKWVDGIRSLFRQVGGMELLTTQFLDSLCLK